MLTAWEKKKGRGKAVCLPFGRERATGGGSLPPICDSFCSRREEEKKGVMRRGNYDETLTLTPWGKEGGGEGKLNLFAREGGNYIGGERENVPPGGGRGRGGGYLLLTFFRMKEKGGMRQRQVRGGRPIKRFFWRGKRCALILRRFPPGREKPVKGGGEWKNHPQRTKRRERKEVFRISA